MSWGNLLIAVGICGWLFSVLLLAAFCGLTDEKPVKPLSRNPNVKAVPYDKDAAA